MTKNRHLDKNNKEVKLPKVPHTMNKEVKATKKKAAYLKCHNKAQKICKESIRWSASKNIKKEFKLSK